MSEKSQEKDNLCLGNISVKGESGVKYVKDELYTDEEVRRAPKGKKHKFTKFDVTVPGFDKGTETELRDLIQRQQIKIKTLEDVLAKYENGKKNPFEDKPDEQEETEQTEKPQGKAITSSTGGQAGEEKL